MSVAMQRVWKELPFDSDKSFPTPVSEGSRASRQKAVVQTDTRSERSGASEYLVVSDVLEVGYLPVAQKGAVEERPDDDRLVLDNDYELGYFIATHKTSSARVALAVEAVGKSRRNVVCWLDRNGR